MKILIIGPFPPPVYGVSLSNFVLENGLSKRGYNVKIINTAGDAKIDSEVGVWHLKKLYFIKTYFNLFKIISTDIIYCTTGQTFFGIIKYAPFVLFSKILGKKAIVHVKGGYLKNSYDTMSTFQKKISKFVLSSYDSGIVLSKSLRYLLTDFLPKNKIFIQHNFIQDSLIIPKDQIFKRKTYGKLQLIYLSNLMKEKGIDELLLALEMMNDKNIDFEAKIAGHIPKNDTTILARMRQIENVEYVGVVHNEEKTELLCWGNVFCLPTYYTMEGQPISLIEAMGFGNVILTTKHAGIPDICSEQNGLFVEKRHVASLLSQLIYLSNNLPWVKKTGAYNIHYARTSYTENAFVQGLIKIMKEGIR